MINYVFVQYVFGNCFLSKDVPIYNGHNQCITFPLQLTLQLLAKQGLDSANPPTQQIQYLAGALNIQEATGDNMGQLRPIGYPVDLLKSPY